MAVKKNNSNKNWSKAVVVNKTNCYSITDIENAVGSISKEKDTRYRGVLRALIGGNSVNKTDQLPHIGSIKLNDEERNLLTGVTKLCLAKDYIIIIRNGNIIPLKLVDIQTEEGYFLSNKIVDNYIKPMIKALESEQNFNPIAKTNLFRVGGVLREVLQAREKTAPNEKKTMCDVLTLEKTNFSEVDEIIILVDSFYNLPKLSKLSQLLITPFQGTPAIIDQSLYLKELQEIANIELEKEKQGLFLLRDRIEAQKLGNIKVLSFVGGKDAALKIQKYDVKSGLSLSEYLLVSGSNVDVIYTSTKLVSNPEKLSKPENSESKEKTVENTELLNIQKEVARKVQEIIVLTNKYNTMLSSLVSIHETTNPTENAIWANTFSNNKLRSLLDKEFEYLSTDGKYESGEVEKLYDEKLSITVLQEFSDALKIENGRTTLELFKQYCPKGSKNDNMTYKSLGLGLQNKEKAKKTLDYINICCKYIYLITDILNAIILKSLADFLLRFGIQGLQFAIRLTPLLVGDGNIYYTTFILKSANRMFRDAKDAPYDMLESEKATLLGQLYDWVKTCIAIYNPEAKPLSFDYTDELVQATNRGIMTNQVERIVEQYKKYLNVGV